VKPIEASTRTDFTTMPSVEEDLRLRRMEEMLRKLSGSLSPQITIGEIEHQLGFNDRTAVQHWLDEHSLKPVAKWRYRRSDFIEARDADRLPALAETEMSERIRVELTCPQVETLCWFLAEELRSGMLEPVHTDDFLAVVNEWRGGRDTWVERYMQRYIDNRENVEHLGQNLDASADLLEQLACKLPADTLFAQLR
jgi:hypothetical protein